MALAPRVVLVHRRSELEELTQRHSTRGQVEFFLKQRGRTLEDVDLAHAEGRAAINEVGVSIPLEWRRAEVERASLPQFLFGPEDIVVVVGRDGLVANVAKYLNGQAVVGFNPFPHTNAGVLTRHAPASAVHVFAAVEAGRMAVEERTMVAATSDDGQEITGLNDVFLGDIGHQSARYVIRAPGAEPESQSSSGIVVGTGTGSTGWLRSLANDRGAGQLLPQPTAPALAWFVREAWPSPYTAAAMTMGALPAPQELTIEVQSDTMIVFGDGIEADRLEASHGQRVTVGVSSRRLRLAV